MPKTDPTTEIEVAEHEDTDIKATIIKTATMVVATAATLAATHFAIKAIENRNKD